MEWLQYCFFFFFLQVISLILSRKPWYFHLQVEQQKCRCSLILAIDSNKSIWFWVETLYPIMVKYWVSHKIMINILRSIGERSIRNIFSLMFAFIPLLWIPAISSFTMKSQIPLSSYLAIHVWTNLLLHTALELSLCVIFSFWPTTVPTTSDDPDEDHKPNDVGLTIKLFHFKCCSSFDLHARWKEKALLGHAAAMTLRLFQEIQRQVVSAGETFEALECWCVIKTGYVIFLHSKLASSRDMPRYKGRERWGMTCSKDSWADTNRGHCGSCSVP